jgi:ABC-type transport system involved in multi-copper enzyme maturation permease subunit
MAANQGILHRLHLDWPLLGKELLEQSARRQLYAMRVIYALVLFGAFCFYYARHLSEGSILTLGRGYGPFSFVVSTQIVTIFLFLPPLMAGAIAQEKERDTLGLLFLTDLTPWELILQKYIGRLIPMLTLLFLSLPLLAVTYSLGGVSFDMLISSAATLFFTCMAVGAVALECSAHESTTFGALIRCWGICLFFTMCCWLGPLSFALSPSRMMGSGAPGILILFQVFFNGLGYLVPTTLFLVRAKQNLEARAFARRQNPFGRQFKQMDHYWRDMRKLMRAILRKRDAEAHAIAQQVVRSQLGVVEDQQQWSLAGFLFAKMQVPNLIAFTVIFGFLIFIVLFFSALMDPKSMPFYIIVGGLWILALLTIPIQSVNAVASERTNERLGAILTSPLTSQEILNEWMSPVRRWTSFLVRPLIFMFVVEAMVKFKNADVNDPRLADFFLYLAISGLTVWIYPRLVMWFCMWIGLRVRNQIRAMMTAFLLVVVWCIGLPPLFSYLVDTNLLPADLGMGLRFVSPVTIIGIAEELGVPKNGTMMVTSMAMLIVAHFALFGALMWRLRQVCLTKADYYLGRV